MGATIPGLNVSIEASDSIYYEAVGTRLKILECR
jgi:hypothetical protein